MISDSYVVGIRYSPGAHLAEQIEIVYRVLPLPFWRKLGDVSGRCHPVPEPVSAPSGCPYTATTTVRSRLFSDHTPISVLAQSWMIAM